MENGTPWYDSLFGGYSLGFILVAVILSILLFGLLLGVIIYASAYSFPPTSLHPIQARSAISTTPIFNNDSEPGGSLPRFGNTGSPGATGTLISTGYPLSSNCQAFLDQVSCQASPGRFWNANFSAVGTCQCINPFWSLDGNREAYNIDYLAVGNPQVNGSTSPDITYAILGSTMTNRLSFPFAGLPASSQTECTVECDKMGDICSGVIWNGPTYPLLGLTNGASGLCTFLEGSVTVVNGRNIPFDPNIDSTLYMKKSLSSSVNPLFDNIAFIYAGTLPLRYWLNQAGLDNTILSALVNNQYQINFYPTGVINSGNLTGIYSLGKIPVNMVQEIISGGTTSQYYINYPNTPLQLPLSWSKLPVIIWLIYVVAS
jgi:hypothetical protein